MLRENILWARALDPMTGRIEKRDTFFGAVLKIVGGAIAMTVVIYAVILLGAVWQFTSK